MILEVFLALSIPGTTRLARAFRLQQPTSQTAPRVSFLTRGCRLETAAGPDWHRLFVNCGSGPYLLSEPSSLIWHAQIETPEQAVELLRLFSSPTTCQRIPGPHFVEIRSSEAGDQWLALDHTTYDTVCPRATATEVMKGGSVMKEFVISRCLMGMDDGHVYRSEERVSENGEVETVGLSVSLRNADARIGRCDPGAPIAAPLVKP